VPKGKGSVSGFFATNGLNGQNGVFFAQKCIRLVCQKLTVFPYAQYYLWNLRFIGFPKIQSSSRLMLGFASNLQKFNSHSDVLASSPQILAVTQARL